MKKRNLRGTGLLLAASLLVMTACSGKEKEPEVYLDESSPETPITLFAQNEAVSEAIEECCRNMLEHDNHMNLTLYGDSAGFYAEEGLSYREILLKRFTSGEADDLYVIPAEDVMEFNEKGYIYDLSDLDCVKNLSKDALDQSTFDGKVFSIPLSYTCFGFVWNVDLLEKYQLTVPESLDEFWHVCETLSQNGILPYGANKDFALTVPAMCAGLNEIYSRKDTEKLLEDLSDGTTPISRYMEKGFDFLQTMMDKGYMDAEQALATTPMSDEEKQYFADGNCGFYCALYRAKTFEGYPFEVQMTPLPVLEEGSVCVVGADQRLAVNPKSKNLKSAVSIIETLGSKESLDTFAKGLGKISSSVNVTAPDIPQSKGLIECVKGGADRFPIRISGFILIYGTMCGSWG